MTDGFDVDAARDFGTALLLGALIGVEREKHNMRQGFGVAGVRSFVLLALIGAVGGYLSKVLALPWMLPVTVVAAATAVVAGYLAGTRKNPDSVGITSELASIFTCLLGALVTSGFRELAIGLGVVAAALLAYKQPLHEMVGRLGWADVLAVMRLLLATFIVLPLLPDEAVDPWGAINPYELWLLVLLISGLSLVGYVAGRWLGTERGVVVTAITGGLVSSTAVTLALARQSRERRAPLRQLAAGAVLAWSITSVRVLVAAAVVSPPLVSRLWLPCSAMALTGGAFAGVLLHARRTGTQVETDVPLKNPFSLWSATKFGLLFAAVSLMLAFAQLHLSGAGTYTVALLAGATDVDAITLSLAGRVREGQETGTLAVVAILLACFSNTVVKVGITVLTGRGLARHVLPAGVAIVAAGVGGLLVVG